MSFYIFYKVNISIISDSSFIEFSLIAYIKFKLYFMKNIIIIYFYFINLLIFNIERFFLIVSFIYSFTIKNLNFKREIPIPNFGYIFLKDVQEIDLSFFNHVILLVYNLIRTFFQYF